MPISQCVRRAFLFAILIVFWTVLPVGAEEPNQATQWANDVQPLLRCLYGKEIPCQLVTEVQAPMDGRQQTIRTALHRISDDAFELHVEHQDYAVSIVRDATTTQMKLPRHKIKYVGTGAVDKLDHLDPRGLLQRLVSEDSKAATYQRMISASEPALLAAMLQGLLKPTYEPSTQSWKFENNGTVTITDAGTQWHVHVGDIDAKIQMQIGNSSTQASLGGASDDESTWRTVELARAEIERQLVRGVRRATEILSPGPTLTSPAQSPRSVEFGELKWVSGQRVVSLRGTPEQIGQAHGQLLGREARKCIDSVLYTFGTAETIRSGRWFRQDLETAFARLSPHIPESHKREMYALADSLGFDRQTMEALNVFPELFHCSGFAVFGKATVGGKLYHGRVLDYMTTIGLQDAATTFAVAPEGKIAFANVGYAAFIGSVSGMNAQGVSLGEMGGRGEGKWDGVPMATLMRRALEECDSLDKVMDLWKNSPRTCEYYYVFADGKSNRAVGVAATPDKIEFIMPGQTDTRLGEGIEDAVVMSAGSRLETLRKRVHEHYGTFDAESAMALMARPVAMNSNLHNVLFVPADRVLYVANATHRQPAADTPYVRLSLDELLTPPHHDVPPESLSYGLRPSYRSSDSLSHCNSALNPDALDSLRHLVWEPADFEVHCAIPKSQEPLPYQVKVTFPSPIASGDTVNDMVSMEWYLATDKEHRPIVAPAVIVVHESGRGMTVGKIFARGLRTLGFHSFLIHLPTYGDRRGHTLPKDLSIMETVMRQGIADVRRARDAVVVLPWVDRNHIALQGTSLGGFVAALAASLDGAFDSVHLMLAGGDIYGMIQRGNLDVKRLRDDAARAGVSDALLRQLTSLVEPNRLAYRLPRDRTWLFSGIFDYVVPYANALSLVRASDMDEEHHVQMLADHYSGIVLLPMVFKTIHDAIYDTMRDLQGSFAGVDANTNQVVCVRPLSSGGWQAEITTWERCEKGWRRSLPTMWGVLGKDGLSAPGEKTEEDRSTPPGVFQIVSAIGSASSLDTGLAYQSVSGTELGVMIECSTDSQNSGKENSMKLHVWKDAVTPTSGGVALPESDLQTIGKWLARDQHPEVVIH